MFELMIATFYYAFYIGLSGILVLFLMRLYMSLKTKLNLKDMLFVLFVPGSVGLGLKLKEHYPLEKLYFYLSIFFFVMIFIGSIFILYLRLELNII